MESVLNQKVTSLVVAVVVICARVPKAVLKMESVTITVTWVAAAAGAAAVAEVAAAAPEVAADVAATKTVYTCAVTMQVIVDV